MAKAHDMKTEEELHKMTAAELRKYFRTQWKSTQIRKGDSIPTDISLPVWSIYAGKTDIIQALLTGTAEYRDPDGTPKPPADGTQQTEPDSEGQPCDPPELPLEPAAPKYDGPLAPAFQMIDQTFKSEIEKATAGLQEQIKEQVKKAVEQIKPRPIQVQTPEGTTTLAERQHQLFELSLMIVSANVPLYLYGPAGSGKTHLGASIAKALGIDFFPYSCDESTQRFDLTGFIDAQSHFSPGILYAPMLQGGLLLLDEIDRSGPAVTVLNSALANGYFTFPVGTIQRHEKARFVAAGNTLATGADNKYTSANRIDAATLDRFAYLNFPYDEELEKHFAGLPAEPVKPYRRRKITTPELWHARVIAIRRAAEKTEAAAIVSPRAVIYGLRLIAAGIDATDIENLLIWNKLAPETVELMKGEL